MAKKTLEQRCAFPDLGMPMTDPCEVATFKFVLKESRKMKKLFRQMNREDEAINYIWHDSEQVSGGLDRNLDFTLRETIKLPNPGCVYEGTDFDEETGIYTIRYSQSNPSGFHSQIINDTGIPLPTDDHDKIKYVCTNEPDWRKKLRK